MSPLHRFLLAAVIVSFSFPLVAYAKAPKQQERGGLAYATFPGQPAPTKDLLGDLLVQARWDDEIWATSYSRGLKLRFVKVDSQTTPQGAFTRYRVIAEGAPENKVYEWRVWRPGQEIQSEPGDIYVNGRGLLMTHRPRPEEELSAQIPGGEFYITPEAGPADPFRYELHSRDSQLVVVGSLVPQPVTAEDHGCTLEVRIARPNAGAVLFVANGLPADSRIPLVLESEGQNATLTMETDNGGRSIVAGFPYVSGKTQGILKATAEGPDCLPAVTLPWKVEAKAPPPTTPPPTSSTAKKIPWIWPHK